MQSIPTLSFAGALSALTIGTIAILAWRHDDGSAAMIDMIDMIDMVDTVQAATGEAAGAPELAPRSSDELVSVSPGLAQPCLASDCEQRSVTVGGDSNHPMVAALRDCVHLADFSGLQRLEIEVAMVGGAPEEGTLVERVVATSGRKVPCGDPVEDAQSADAPGVVRHDAMAECILESMDPAGYSFSPLEPGEQQHFTQIMGLDGHQPDQQLPQVPEDEAVIDPMEAIEAFALPPMPGTAADPKVHVVECGDYDCPFCRQSEALLDELRERHGGALSIHWLHNPLAMHDTALPAARAAVAAQRQGKFWEYHQALMADAAPHERDRLLQTAQSVGLDLERFESDLDDPSTAETVARQARVCQLAGARGTPSFFVEGDLVVGASQFDELSLVIDEALASP